jgi:hypothetical protein
MQFQVTMGTNCQALTRYVNVSYVIGSKQANSVFSV